MKYKLRIVHMKDGSCRIQKKHWLLTLGFWVTLHDKFSMEYYVFSEDEARSYILEYYTEFENQKIVKYEEI